MNKKWENMKKKYQENGQLRQRIYIGCLLIAVCCLLVGILAKYIHQSVSEKSQITADKFYFTTNILGDTKMTASDGSEGTSYAFDDKSTEMTWNLYGAGRHDIQIQVQNYFDDLRITEQDIKFDGNVTVQDKEGKDISNTLGSSKPEIKLGTDTFSNGTLKSGSSDKKAQADLTLSIPSHTDWNYSDGTVVTAKIKSTSPYKKTLTMKFILYSTDTTLKYKVVDSAGSPYAELILMNNMDSAVKPYLNWADALSIDNTNPLTYQYENGTFVQQQGMTERNMQLSQELKVGQSESIYFFKSDTSKNYSKSETVVTPDENKKYEISVK